MTLLLERPRLWQTPTATIGKLLIGNIFFCYTLEDAVRPYPHKVDHITAIWEGLYQVVIDYSTRFDRLMPHILDVPLFSGVRIHSGNTASDTEGCVLLGMRRDPNDPNRILDSRKAFDAFFPILGAELKRGPVRLLVSSEPQPLRPEENK